MIARALVAVAAVALLGCGRQSNVTTTASAASPQPSPVASAEPADPLPAGQSAPADPAQPSLDSKLSKLSALQPRESKPSALRPRQVERAPVTAMTIPSGTRIRVRLAQALDTKYARPGGTFEATLDEPIVSGGRVIVPKGTPFTGTVVAAKPSGRFKGRAYLQVTLRSFRMGGIRYQVATIPDTRVSGNHKKRNLAFLGGGPAAGAGIGAIAGGGPGALIGAGVGAAAGATTTFFTGRKQVRLPVESELTFSLRSDVQVRRG